MRVVLDVESNNLLNSESIDYSTTPYKLRSSFIVWCICVIDLDTREEYSFVGDEEIRNKFVPFSKQFTEIASHNGCDFDWLLFKMYLGLDYELEVYPLEDNPDLFDGRRITLTDTLILSKVLNPDRYLGHSLGVWGERLGEAKTDWRGEAVSLGLITKDAPRGAEFQVWHPRMLDYCLQDCRVNVLLYHKLQMEQFGWDWADAISLEKATAYIVTIGAHRGFAFDSELALQCIQELDQLIEERRARVEPILPPKPIGKTLAKQVTPLKKQFLKNGDLRPQTIEWVEKHGGVVREVIDGWEADIFGKTYALPLPDEPLITEIKTTLKDTTFIKGWLIEQGWSATNWKERDLTTNTKKQKITQEQFVEVVRKYVESTLGTPFEKDRLEHLECTAEDLQSKLLKHDITKPLKVLTYCTFTVGQDKEICPNLLLLNEKFPYSQDVVEFLTYQHRRNSILGGGVTVEDFADEDVEDPNKGFLAYVREDGRIPTPANPCGAATSRFLHKITANIPRTTSLYGDKMRALFGVKEGFYQLGYDFDSLEAIITACLIHPFPGGVEYGKGLIAKKPNDVHTALSVEISKILGTKFARSTAKSCAYGMIYNAQAKRVAKIVGSDLRVGEIIFNQFWKKAASLKAAKEMLQKYWQTTGMKKFIMGIDGRKIPIRSKGNVVNSWAQCSGVTCAKRAAVLLRQKMRKAGYLVDVFKESDTKEKSGQSIILYHDEQALEVTKDLVKFKMFETEEEAKTYKQNFEVKNNKRLSDVQHTKDKYFVAYCPVGEMCVEAVRESGEYYKLPLALSAGYTVGKNWRDTHG